ncbi:hypothetical protein WMY93_011277 [Mugilogobius chulae]|uniref:Uncharacterized protein n=1 Tax=Mugilogobius chulae TaxID=88201 RepID=A0AAW0P7X2_9GOBI
MRPIVTVTYRHKENQKSLATPPYSSHASPRPRTVATPRYSSHAPGLWPRLRTLATPLTLATPPDSSHASGLWPRPRRWPRLRTLATPLTLATPPDSYSVQNPTWCTNMLPQLSVEFQTDTEYMFIKTATV